MRDRVAICKTIAAGLIIGAAGVCLLVGYHPEARRDFALLAQLIEPDDHRALTGCLFPPYPGPMAAAEVAARALGACPETVRIDGVHAICRGINHATTTIEAADGARRQVHLGYEADTGLLRSVHWADEATESPPSIDALVSIDEARSKAEQLMARLLPPVPVDLDLISEEPTGVILVDGESCAMYYVFRWEAEIADGVRTGDSVNVYICRVTGEPYRYSQRLAPLRPAPEEIAVSREAALKIALEAAGEQPQAGGPAATRLQDLDARLVLSSLISPEQGPVWLVDADARSAQSTSAEAMQIAVDAMTGEVLRP